MIRFLICSIFQIVLILLPLSNKYHLSQKTNLRMYETYYMSDRKLWITLQFFLGNKHFPHNLFVSGGTNTKLETNIFQIHGVGGTFITERRTNVWNQEGWGGKHFKFDFLVVMMMSNKIRGRTNDPLSIKTDLYETESRINLIPGCALYFISSNQKGI